MAPIHPQDLTFAALADAQRIRVTDGVNSQVVWENPRNVPGQEILVDLPDLEEPRVRSLRRQVSLLLLSGRKPIP